MKIFKISLSYYSSVLFWTPIVLLCGCSNFLDIAPPKTEMVTQSVFEDDNTSNAAMLVIYAQMANSNGGYSPYRIPLLAGLSSDEFTNYSTVQNITAFYSNSLSTLNTYIPGYLWAPAYSYIYQANAVIEGLDNSEGVSGDVKQQIIGEAKFIRAFWHFYLVNFFGDIPLVTNTDYSQNALIFRSPVDEVYAQIIRDLSEAEGSMSEVFVGADGLSPSSERVRPNKFAAKALLARAYLFIGDYANAELQATEVIQQSDYELLADLDAVFLKNSREAIWQLEVGGAFTSTPEAMGFVLTGAPSSSLEKITTVSPQLLFAFEEGDERKSHWIGVIGDAQNSYYFPHKYKISNAGVNEYSVVLRLAEQYLIRAEVRAHQNNTIGALSDLNMIRERAGLASFTDGSGQSILEAIEQERQVELFAEWGHRWFDLKRTGRIDAVMGVVTPAKGGNWESSWQLYPIPQTERDNNPNLSQNSGY